MAEGFQYKSDIVPHISDLLALYNDANWLAYTKESSSLLKAIEKSLHVVSVYDGEQLIALLRVIGDDATIAYIQDILVKKSYKRRGIGSSLIQMALKRFKHCRQFVLLTDESTESRSFYESLGFKSCDDGKLVAFTRV